jgi:hypothetical protein
MIDLRDRRRMLTELLIAELLARPGQPGPLARPVWPRGGSPPPVVPKPKAAARPPEPERR